jgi:transcription-repair coupling factor (superfamily II helicase)
VNEAQTTSASAICTNCAGAWAASNKKAFCYLLAPARISCLTCSRKRLQAIEQFSDLGSGIHIAMKDLDIRGAGDLLGAEQSGFINDIGFETYHKILEEAVRELKERALRRNSSPTDRTMRWPAVARRDQSDDCIIEGDLPMLIPQRLRAARPPNASRSTASLADINRRGRAATLRHRGHRPLRPRCPHEVYGADGGDPLCAGSGQRLGLEKMVHEEGRRCVGTFIADQKHRLLRGGHVPDSVLRAVQAQPKRFKVFERNGTLRISVAEVKTVAQAKQALEGVVGLKT